MVKTIQWIIMEFASPILDFHGYTKGALKPSGLG